MGLQEPISRTSSSRNSTDCKLSVTDKDLVMFAKDKSWIIVIVILERKGVPP